MKKWVLIMAGLLLAAPAFAGYGIRGAVGFGLGTSTTTFGEGDRQLGSEYTVTPSNGLAGGLEFLLSASNKLEFGLGVFAPLAINADESSTYTATSGWRYTDSTTLKSSHLPILASMYLRQPMQGKLSLVAGAGIGVVMPGDIDYKSTVTTVTTSGSQYFDYTSMTIESNMAVGYRGVLGLEVELSPSLSFFGGLNFIAASLSPDKATKTVTNSYNTNTETETVTFQSDPPDRRPSTTTTTTSGGYTTVVTDDGITRTTTTTGGGRTVTVRDIKAVTESRAADQLAVLLGLTFWF